MRLLGAAADAFSNAPLTTGALFLALTGAITYLYRARDRDHDYEVSRLEKQIERLERLLDEIRKRERET